jgi:Uma2 family endonuclease
MTALEALSKPQQAKLTVEDFVLLDRSGAFSSHAKAELIDGTIYVVNAQYAEHMKAKVRLLRRLADACDALEQGLEAWSEGSIDMAPGSMPEPDLLITSETPQAGPVRKDIVRLIVEVADTTLEMDLGEKVGVYATAGVPEYWVVDLKGRVIRQLWSPGPEGYARRREVAFGERMAAATIAGLAVETAGLN